MVFLTGDIHGSYSIRKLGSKKWLHGKELSKTDYVIILGDFGLLWNYEPDKEELYWLQWLADRPFTTLFLDGNHENHPRLLTLPLRKMFGSEVGYVRDSVYHLRRGNIYTINEKTFFVMGGARSIDKSLRIEGSSWWPEEVPSYTEMDYGIANLLKYNNSVDYILAHTAPVEIIKKVLGGEWLTDPTTKYLQHICNTISFKAFYCGHFHKDITYEKYNILSDLATIKEII